MISTGNLKNNIKLETDTLLKDSYRVENLICNDKGFNIYRGTSVGKEQEIIIKELSPESFLSTYKRDIAINQFKMDISLLSELSHPNLPDFIETFDMNGRNYIVISTVKGDNLSVYIKKQKDLLSEEKLVDLGLELCNVIEYLHSRTPEPIIFKGLCPENIFISEENKLLLSPFGTGGLFIPLSMAGSIERNTKMHYSPLEEYVSRPDTKSDIYSTGAILYYLTTKENPVDAFDRGLNGINLPPCRYFNSSIGSDFEEVVFKSMALERKDRYDSITSMKKDLENIKCKKSENAEEKVKEEKDREKTFLSGIFNILRCF